MSTQCVIHKAEFSICVISSNCFNNSLKLTSLSIAILQMTKIQEGIVSSSEIALGHLGGLVG